MTSNALPVLERPMPLQDAATITKASPRNAPTSSHVAVQAFSPVRREWKFLVPHVVRASLSADLATITKPDAHSKAGDYIVRSLYFDSPGWSCAMDKLNGADERRKVRIRAYARSVAANEWTSIKLEVKRRRGEWIEKSAAAVSLQQYDDIMIALRRRRLPDVSVWRDFPGAIAFFRELLLESMRPVMMVQFARRAQVERTIGHCRITLDGSLSCWRADDLFHSPKCGRKFLPFASILEIKAAERMPFWADRLIQKYRLLRQPFSKYATAAALLHDVSPAP